MLSKVIVRQTDRQTDRHRDRIDRKYKACRFAGAQKLLPTFTSSFVPYIWGGPEVPSTFSEPETSLYTPTSVI